MIEKLLTYLEFFIAIISTLGVVWWIFEIIGRIKFLEIEMDKRVREIIDFENKLQEFHLLTIDLFHEIEKVQDLKTMIFYNDERIEKITLLLNRFILRVRQEVKESRIRITRNTMRINGLQGQINDDIASIFVRFRSSENGEQKLKM